MIKKRLKHDEKTCFRCRLADLFTEVKKDNDPRFVLLSMAEACGSILAQLDDEAKFEFATVIFRSYQEDKESGAFETKH
jgi:hypothetical protein